MKKCCSKQHLQRQADKTGIRNIQTKHQCNLEFENRREAFAGRGVNHACPFPRGSSIPRCARLVGTLPSFRARCAMAARCLCSATASRILSKPSSALPATRTACSRVWAAVGECVQVPWPDSLAPWQEPRRELQHGQRNLNSAALLFHSHC